jgi:uncharacterized membrane protein YgcG
MKKIFQLLHVVALLAIAISPVFAQQADCNAPINDVAHVLNTSDVAAISNALGQLKAVNADGRVITTNENYPMPIDYAKAMKSKCSSWVNSSNLVLFFLFPDKKKMDVLSQGSFKSGALNTNVTTAIKTNYIGPNFGSKQYGLGFVNGIQQAAVRINAFNHSAERPVVNDHRTIINNNKPKTDYSGLWKVFEVLILLALVIVGVIVGFKIYNSRKERKLAHLDAISARNSATSLLSRLTDALKEKAALGVKVSASQAELDSLAAEFANLGVSLQYDPSDSTLSKEEYENISSQYNSILRELKGISTDGDAATKKARKKVQAAYVAPVEDSAPENEAPSYREPNYSPTPSYSSTPAAQPTGQTTIIHEDHYHDDSSSLLTGVLVGEALSRPAYSEPVYREPSYSAPARDDSSSYGRNDDSSNFGGSSNNDSYSSRNDDSSSFSSSSDSSSYDSGSSSDFGGSDSSSSDFGSSDSSSF